MNKKNLFFAGLFLSMTLLLWSHLWKFLEFRPHRQMTALLVLFSMHVVEAEAIIILISAADTDILVGILVHASYRWESYNC